MKRVLKRSLWALLILAGLLGIALLVVIFTNVWVVQYPDTAPATMYQAAKLHPNPAKAPDSLRVLNWNIKFGGGRLDFFFDCYGDRTVMTEAEVIRHLQGIARFIDSLNPDVVLIQEIDVASKRVAGIDQVQWLLDHTRLNYAAYASQWHVHWMPAHGLGYMNSGLAVLSRYPLQAGTRHALPQMAEQPALTRFFYLRRCILQTAVVLPGKAPLTVLNTHLEAYSTGNTKASQLGIFVKLADSLRQAGQALLLGGDLNTLPPGAKKQHGFDDSVCKDEFVADDYRAETELLAPLYKGYASAIPLATYLADEARHWGHSVNGKGWWNRTLDYLFSTHAWAQGSGRVHQQGTYHLSDHAPLSGVLLPAR